MADSATKTKPTWPQTGMVAITFVTGLCGIVFSLLSVEMQSESARMAASALRRKVSTSRTQGDVRLAVTLALLKRAQLAESARLTTLERRVAKLEAK